MADDPTQPTDPAAAIDPPEPKPTDPAASEADGTDWKALSRQWEKRAKENKAAAEELEKVKAAAMTDQEKAVTEAEKRGRLAAVLEVGKQLAAARFEVAAAKAKVDLGDAADLIDTGRFVDAKGEVDTAAIEAAVKKLAKVARSGPTRSGGEHSGGPGNTTGRPTSLRDAYARQQT